MKQYIPIFFSLIPSICIAKENKQPDATHPNIVFILADDLGIGDLGCYGQQQLRTPNIDRLAENGMRFMNHYAGCSVSAPSRCALLTGKHMGHAYIRRNIHVSDHHSNGFDYPLAASEITIAELLKKCNYTTACIGKWGLGGPESEGATARHGFDYFFGHLGQRAAHKYYPDYLWENDKKIILNKQQYAATLITKKAVEFINQNISKPFFLYFTPTLPHAELIVPEEALQEFDGQFIETAYKGNNLYGAQKRPRAAYAAMVKYLDDAVGQIVKTLKENGALENTIILFSSDNGVHQEGGHNPEYFNSNGQYRGIKRDLYEGGIHTPFIVQWKNTVAKGTTTEHISAFWDFLPTIADLIGVDIPKTCDGISYLPTLLNKGKQKKHDFIYHEDYENGGKQSVIKNGWKLVRLNMKNKDAIVEELYNLSKDPEERYNVKDQHTKILKKLRTIALKNHTPSPIFQWEKLR